ncbi:hypothetical protein QQS21_010432 [Conoideocrella luteorostrata]|uniref:Uncharacterized protein n=1 Tax=Conoideocrella luteorostrata TaxID=1105319 RepID=A0AAJ0CFB8_9HYPO|nr:hypothetical protein QQS21_010432 [Conoideocrella luteorostrata]
MQFFDSSRKGGALFFLFSLLSSLLLLSSQSCTALAAPVNDFTAVIARNDKNIPSKDEVEKLIKSKDLKDFEKYAKKHEPGKDKAIFFTGQDGKTINKIVKWATDKDRGLTSVRNIWKSANFYNKGQYKDVSDEDFKKFQKAFSKFYAHETKGKAYLIFPHDKKPAKSGIFWSVELDEIIDHKEVDEIIWLDQNKIDKDDYKWKDEKKIYWKKGEKKPDGA